METEYQTPFYKQTWFLGGLAALAVFALCFFAINYVSQPDEPKAPEVEKKVIASVHTNEELIMIAREQGWIKADATEMTSVDAAEVDSLGEAFVGSDIESLNYLFSANHIHIFCSVCLVPDVAGKLIHAVPILSASY